MALPSGRQPSPRTSEMYTGALAAASNRARWTFSVELTDPETDEAIDLTGATIELAVRDQNSKIPLLTGSTDTGKITIATPATSGAFTVLFEKQDMSVLADGMYDVGLRVTLSDDRDFQLIVATLPVVDGIVDT